MSSSVAITRSSLRSPCFAPQSRGRVLGMCELQLAHRARECKFGRARPNLGSTVALVRRNASSAVYKPDRPVRHHRTRQPVITFPIAERGPVGRAWTIKGYSGCTVGVYLSTNVAPYSR